MDSKTLLKKGIPKGYWAHNKAPLGSKPDWEFIPKRKPKRMSYNDVFQVITKYAPEMKLQFADKFSRFPEGFKAAVIANHLNDKADFYRTKDKSTANELKDAADEIISRTKTKSL